MAEQYVIIGNGIAGATAAEVLRAEDASAEITVIADDPFPVYYRPALKDYLAGRVHEDKLWARPASFYQDQRIRFLSERVVAIQAGRHLVQLQSNRSVDYHHLLLASGARASRLDCPGSTLFGVATLRTVADYQTLQQYLRQARRVVVSGSGTLALETIETLRHRGYQVSHLIRRRLLWSEILDQTASDLVLQQERRAGVEVHVEEEIAEITGRNGQVSGIVTTRGTRIPCEVVLIAIGVEPGVDFIKSSGIPCERGVMVDAAMRTAAPDIYAAGDVLETVNPLSGEKRVIGQWYPAIQQARAAAYSMLGLLDTSRPFSAATFYNATFLYGLDFASVGLTRIPRDGQGYQELIAEPQPRVYRKILLKEGVPVGMLALGERAGGLALKRALDHRVNLLPVAGKLFDPAFHLSDWLDKQGVPPAILGVSREGATTVRQAVGTQTVLRPPEMAGEAFLILQEQPEDQSLPIKRTRLSQTKVMTIGRQPGIAILIDHPSISRRHAEVTYANGQYVLRDVGSSNGTFVNGRSLPTGNIHFLQAGEQILFGRVAYLFTLEALARATAARPASSDLAGKTHLVKATGFYDPAVAAEAVADSSQPLLRADGSLLFPGARLAIPAATVATFQSSPVLVAIVRGEPELIYLKQNHSYVLGREKSDDIFLPDMGASRKHAEVFAATDGFYIRDLGSSNGVKVNQTRITNPYHLEHGDRILIGGTSIYFLHQELTEEIMLVPLTDLAGLCSRCGQTNPERAAFCVHCGEALKQRVLL